MRRLWRTTFGVVFLASIFYVVATLAIAALAFDVTHEALEKQLDHRVAVETRALLGEAREGGFAGIADAIRRRAAVRSGASLDYLLVDDKDQVHAATVQALGPLVPGYEEFFRFRRGNYQGVAQAQTTKISGGMLVVAADRADLREIDRTLSRLFAIALAAMLALGLAAAIVVGVMTRRRLSRIDATAQAIIGGDLSRRVPRDHSGSEFDRLAGTLNVMLDRIAGLMDNLRQVSSDVAHDLRTPLTRLYNQLERAQGQRGEVERAAAIGIARDQAAELLEIFAALLRIAEVEGLAERRALGRVDVSALVAEMEDTYRPDMEATGHILVAEAETDLAVAGDRRLIAQAMSNLLDNAIRHTPAGSTVRLMTRDKAGAVQISVEDDGPGVADADRARLFQRFARSEAARSTPGHGLGLALVRAVAIAHGGTVELSPSTAGFGITLAFPRLGAKG